ncbi:MAG: hypothetical protein IPG66_17150 [Hydrogenophilales bacterium]|nr:hypothetical protein [Hydrogenophilales bacterium]
MTVEEPNAQVAKSMDTTDALALFGDAGTSPELRRNALTTLITAKVLPKQADDPAVVAGREILLSSIVEADEPSSRLLSIAESIRLGQVVKRWAPEIGTQLRKAITMQLPAMQLLTEGDDRLNLARACAQLEADWLPGYLATSIA